MKKAECFLSYYWQITYYIKIKVTICLLFSFTQPNVFIESFNNGNRLSSFKTQICDYSFYF